MTSKTKIKVKRSELLKIVEGRLRKAEKEHERSIANHPQSVETWRAQVIAKLEKEAEAIRKGKVPQRSYIDIGTAPIKPSENGRELCDLRRLHKTLQIGAEDSVLLSQEDADSYFGPCAL